MITKKVATTVKYNVPAWNYCNCQLTVFGGVSKETCRFCVKTKKGYSCALYNEPLTVTEGMRVDKTRECAKVTAGFNSTVEDAPQIDPQTVIKTTIDEYNRIRKQLLAQGYPAAIAEKFAKDTLLGR